MFRVRTRAVHMRIRMRQLRWCGADRTRSMRSLGAWRHLDTGVVAAQLLGTAEPSEEPSRPITAGETSRRRQSGISDCRDPASAIIRDGAPTHGE